MLVKGIGYAQVAFGIFKVYGVHFVRHGAATYLSGLHLLLKVLHRYVLPHIAAQVYEYGVDALQGIKLGGYIVVMFYLRGVLHTLQPQFFIQ